MIAHIEFDDKSIEERIEKAVGLLRAAQMEIAGLLALPIKVGNEEKTPAEKAGAEKDAN